MSSSMRPALLVMIGVLGVGCGSDEAASVEEVDAVAEIEVDAAVEVEVDAVAETEVDAAVEVEVAEEVDAVAEIEVDAAVEVEVDVAGEVEVDAAVEVDAVEEVEVVEAPRCGDGIVTPGELCLGRSVTADIGEGTRGALVDLDGDRFDELVTLSASPLAVAVRPGYLDGAFGLARVMDIDADDEGRQILTGDVIGGSAPDVLVVTSRHVYVLGNDGDGGLSPPTVPAFAFASGNDSPEVALVDVVGDSALELVVTGDRIRVYDCDGAGHFTEVGEPPELSGPVGLLTTGDLNADARTDVVAVLKDGSGVVIGIGNGAGFTTTTLPISGNGIFGHALITTLDGDAHADLVVPVLTFPNTDLRRFLGDGNGNFTPASGADPQVATFMAGLTSVHANDDAAWDLVVLGDRGITPLLAAGDGTFSVGSPFGAEMQPSQIIARDTDRDGRDELLLLGDYNGAKIVQATPDGTGGYSIATADSEARVIEVAGAELVDPVLADLNEDGLLDLAIASATGDFRVGLGDGAGGFGVFTTVATQAGTQGIAVGDLDEDGHLDLVATNTLDDSVSVRFGDGDGGFVARAPSELVVGGGPSRVAVIDIDGDGDLDILTTNVGTSGGSSGPNASTVSVRLGDGQGGFVAAEVAEIPSGDYPDAIAIADLDGDGVLDFVAGNTGSPTTVHLGLGEGRFEDAPPVALRATRRFALGDFSGGPAIDLVGVDAGQGFIELAEGNGDGTFAEVSVVMRVASGCEMVDVADLDGDGRDDLVLSGTTGWSVLLGRAGGGAFERPDAGMLMSIEGRWGAVGDLDGDGVLDLVATSGSSVQVLLAKP